MLCGKEVEGTGLGMWFEMRSQGSKVWSTYVIDLLEALLDQDWQVALDLVGRVILDEDLLVRCVRE